MKRIWTICILASALAFAACVQPNAPAAPAVAAERTADPQPQSVEVVIDVAPAETFTPIPAPTAEPTSVSTETPVPADTPESSPIPTPVPAPLSFTASLDYPLPDITTQIQKGRPFWIDGTVTSIDPLVRVGAVVTDSNGKTRIDAEITFDPADGVTSYQLIDNTFNREITDLGEQIKIQNLPEGTFTLAITAMDAAGRSATVAECRFKVTNSSWIQLQPNNLRGNYTTALAFFGSPERFLFKFKPQKDSNLITVDTAWRDLYDAEAVCVKGKLWRCHVDAVPYFEAAGKYIDSTYIHISSDGPGRRFDTGVVWLADLVTQNGSILRRFTNSNLFVSHHSFGTAVDINAYYLSNKDKLINRERIYQEVTEYLTYNGIKEIDGRLVYDFTYTGNASAGLCDVPESVMNYLLYEFGFYRAGFSWGVYYPHTSDAMHFTLTELSPTYFTEGEYAMRKVFTYIDDSADASQTPYTLAFESFDGGGPSYSAAAEDPAIVQIDERIAYNSDDHEEADGAPYRVLFDLTGKQAGETTLTVTAYSPLSGAEEWVYRITVDGSLAVSAELLSYSDDVAYGLNYEEEPIDLPVDDLE